MGSYIQTTYTTKWSATRVLKVPACHDCVAILKKTDTRMRIGLLVIGLLLSGLPWLIGEWMTGTWSPSGNWGSLIGLVLSSFLIWVMFTGNRERKQGFTTDMVSVLIANQYVQLLRFDREASRRRTEFRSICDWNKYAEATIADSWKGSDPTGFRRNPEFQSEVARWRLTYDLGGEESSEANTSD